MDPNVKQRWLAALRSRKIRQAREQLRNGDAYCCLGVLCELYRQDHQRTARWQGTEGTGSDFTVDGTLDSDWAELPRAVAEWAGLDWAVQGGACFVPALLREPNAKRRTLAGLNDDGVPFDGIADVIEAHL